MAEAYIDTGAWGSGPSFEPTAGFTSPGGTDTTSTLDSRNWFDRNFGDISGKDIAGALAGGARSGGLPQGWTGNGAPPAGGGGGAPGSPRSPVNLQALVQMLMQRRLALQQSATGGPGQLAQAQPAPRSIGLLGF